MTKLTLHGMALRSDDVFVMHHRFVQATTYDIFYETYNSQASIVDRTVNWSSMKIVIQSSSKN